MSFKEKSCPSCNETGGEIVGDEETTLVCINDNCRVFTFATYWG